MPGLDPGIHVFLSASSKQDVDGRDEPGHDAGAREFKPCPFNFISLMLPPVSG